MLKKLPKSVTTVTALSKTLAVVVFLTIPFIAFLLGMRYQEMVDNTKQIETYTTTPVYKTAPTSTPNNLQGYATQSYTFYHPKDWKIISGPKSTNPSVLEYIELKGASGNPIGGVNYLKINKTDTPYTCPTQQQQDSCEILLIDNKKAVILSAYGFFDARIPMEPGYELSISYYGFSDEEKNNFKQFLSTFSFPDSQKTENKTCGGLAGGICPNGYTCAYPSPIYPDAAGTCLKAQ